VTKVKTGEVSVGGVRSPLIWAGDRDDPEAVVFVHGNPGSGRDFEDLVARSGEFGRALAFDLPGFGAADKPAGFDYSIEGYVEHMDAAFERLGIERAHLVVHDFGGPFGMAWAAQHPQAFASMVTINAGFLTARRWHRVARLWRRPLIGEVVMAATNRRSWRRAFGAGDELPVAFVDRMYDEFDRGTRRAVLRLYRATPVPYPGAEGWLETLRELDRPGLVVWGAKDPYLAPRRIDEIRRAFPSAEVAMLDQSGHFPFIDDPEATAAAVVPFLRSQLAVAVRG